VKVFSSPKPEVGFTCPALKAKAEGVATAVCAPAKLTESPRKKISMAKARSRAAILE